MAISKRLRFEILRRDGFKCRYCGKPAAERELRVDHVTPVALGGRDEPSNLVASCEPCNSGKSSSNPDAPLVADVNADAIRWQHAWAVAIAEAQQNSEQRAKLIAKVKRNYVTAYKGRHGEAPILPEGWQSSVGRWLDLGMTVELIDQAISAAVGRSNIRREERWAYFAGCCWGRIKDLRDRTAEIAEARRSADDPAEAEDESAIQDRMAATFSGAWSRGEGDEIPTDDQWRTLDTHVTAAQAAGYCEPAIETAARHAGRNHDPRLCDYLRSPNDVFDEVEFAAPGTPATRLGIDMQYAPSRAEREADAVAAAARAVWVSTWEKVHGSRPSDEDANAVFGGAWDLYPDDFDAAEILRGAQWAVEQVEPVDIVGGMMAAERHAETDLAVSAWQRGWVVVSDELPDEGARDRVEKACETLRVAGCWTHNIVLAAAFAGAHATTNLHFGLTDADAKSIGVYAPSQRIMDLWVGTWHQVWGRWPTPDQYKAARQSLWDAGETGTYLVPDVMAAAVTAATYQSADLFPGLLKSQSALQSAAAPVLAGGK